MDDWVNPFMSQGDATINPNDYDNDGKFIKVHEFRPDPAYITLAQNFENGPMHYDDLVDCKEIKTLYAVCGHVHTEIQHCMLPGFSDRDRRHGDSPCPGAIEKEATFFDRELFEGDSRECNFLKKFFFIDSDKDAAGVCPRCQNTIDYQASGMWMSDSVMTTNTFGEEEQTRVGIAVPPTVIQQRLEMFQGEVKKAVAAQKRLDQAYRREILEPRRLEYLLGLDQFRIQEIVENNLDVEYRVRVYDPSGRKPSEYVEKISPLSRIPADEVCCMCQEELHDEEIEDCSTPCKMQTDKCPHMAHYDCYHGWFKQKETHTCPVCSEQIPGELIRMPNFSRERHKYFSDYPGVFTSPPDTLSSFDGSSIPEIQSQSSSSFDGPDDDEF